MSTVSAHPLRSLFFFIALSSAIAFTALTGLVYFGRLHTVDFNLTVKIQDKFPKRFDDNIAALIDFGAMEIQAIIFVVVLALLPVSKKMKLALVMVYIGGLLITLMGKSLLPHPAPPYMFQRGNQGLAFPGLHVQVDSSYPSGHTFRVVFVACMVLLTWIKNTKKTMALTLASLCTSLFAMIVLVGLIVLGKHWSSDVIGGLSLSIFLVSCVFSLSFLRSRS